MATSELSGNVPHAQLLTDLENPDSEPIHRLENLSQTSCCSAQTASIAGLALAAISAFGISAASWYGVVQTNYLVEEDPSALAAVAPIYIVGITSAITGCAMAVACWEKFRRSGS